MTIWKAILLIYEHVDVRVPGRWWLPRRFSHTLSEKEITDAIMSFERFPSLVADLTADKAMIDYNVVRIARALDSLTCRAKGMFWPSPNDTRLEIDDWAPPGRYDSIFVFWPQNDLEHRRSIPTGGWGLGMAASGWSNDATYAAVGNVPSFAWRIPKIGEVWLHEWLHGVCAHFRDLGHIMPSGDADGGSRHGYVQSETTGWTDYYRDLMNGCVLENERLAGIRPEGWLHERQSFGENKTHA